MNIELLIKELQKYKKEGFSEVYILNRTKQDGINIVDYDNDNLIVLLPKYY